MKSYSFRIFWRNFITINLFLITLFFRGTSDAFAVTDEWAMTDSLNSARQWHTATTLQDGKVLITGGQDFTSTLSSAELYDPSSGLWTPTGSMINGRYHHIAVLLQNGKVLVAGGQNNTEALSSAELFNPETGLWEATSSLSIARNNATATLLSNGKVLVAGGYSNDTNLSTTEIYDPVSGTWTSSGSMNNDRSSHTSTLLLDGKVLVSGGLAYYESYSQSLTSAELYDPDLGIWELITPMNSERYGHTSTLLPSGKVLIAGGFSRIHYNTGCNWNIRSLITAELFDPVANTWEFTDSMSSVRGAHTANLLPNGKVLLTGGADYVDQCGVEFHSYTINISESFDPTSETWVDIRTLNNARKDHTSVSLLDGSTLIAGGWYENAPTSYSYSSAELINFNLAPIADAGEDQTVDTLSLVTLDGSGSNDPDNFTPLSYQWSQISGIIVALDDETAVNPTFTAPDDPDILTFSLLVTNSLGLVSETDEVIITVNNQAPVADAGVDQYVKLSSLVTLDGNASSDPDNDIPLSYQWSQIGGTLVTLTGSTTTNPTFTAPDEPEILTFSLEVTDSLVLASEVDEVIITVNNQAPIANAGVDQSVNRSSFVTLDGSLSSDPDGDLPLGYYWTQTSGPTVTLSSQSIVNPNFTAPEDPAELTFSLVVIDGLGAPDPTPDEVTIYVNNQDPVANAGSNQTVNRLSSVTLDGSLSNDPENDLPLTYQWTQTDGTSVTLNDDTSVNPSFTAPNVVDTLTFSLVVSDSYGAASEADEVIISINNQAPIADAGIDQSVKTLSQVTLDGSSSSDPDGDTPLTYQWTQISGTDVTLINDTTLSPQFTAPGNSDTLIFSLIVTDSLGLDSIADTVSIEVQTYKLFLPIIVN